MQSFLAIPRQTHRTPVLGVGVSRPPRQLRDGTALWQHSFNTVTPVTYQDREYNVQLFAKFAVRIVFGHIQTVAQGVVGNQESKV